MLRIAATTALLLASVQAHAAVNLVVNPGFETGDFTGWTVDTTGGTLITSGNPFAGDFDARLRTVDDVTRTLSQIVLTTPGSYQLAYYLRNTGTFEGEDAAIDGLTVVSGSTVTVFGNRPAFSYGLFTQNFVATGPTTISFTYVHPIPGSFQLDEVSVTAIPEASTWAMLVSGFALVGFASRRRSVARAA